MNKESSISVSIEVPLEDTQAVIVLIERFLKKNNIAINLSIVYDYEMEESGVYKPFDLNQIYRIFVNPLNCKTQSDIFHQNFEEPFCPGSHSDLTIFGVTIHEFCHLLQYQIYPSIIQDYIQNFQTDRFNLNGYSNNEIHDELAEIMTLYITNPYLLFLISKPHFNFCKKYFKSPVPCSPQRCFIIYKGFPVKVKEEIKQRWGITYNYCSKNFTKVKNGKV